jgi:type II secretory pathway predicted ATPase ExeA
MSLYLEHFGLSEPPFRITPGVDFFYDGARRGETLRAVRYAIESGEGLVKVVGEVGTGKTMLCRVIMRHLPAHIQTVYLAIPSLSRDEILEAICTDLGIEIAAVRTPQLLKALQERLLDLHQAGKRVVLLIDEAHAMPIATLEELRLLSNLETSTEKLIQLVLFGQPELDEHLAQPNMRQLKERITHSFHLEPLPPRDIEGYVDFRLRQAGYKGPALFSSEALKLIAEASEGLSRRINIYADKTLLAAFAAGTHTLTADHARAAINDTRLPSPAAPAPSPAGGWRLAGGAVAGMALLCLAALAGYWWGKGKAVPPPAPAPLQETRSVPPSPAALAQGAAVSAPAAPEPLANAPMPLATPVTLRGPDLIDADRLPAALVLPARPVGSRLASATIERAAEHDRDRILATDGDHFLLLLMVAEVRRQIDLERFLDGAGKPLVGDLLLIAPTGSAGQPKLSLAYGPFPTRAGAESALSALPAPVRELRPSVRVAKAIKGELRK